jgi:type II secretory pathway pseudopilin PulG
MKKKSSKNRLVLLIVGLIILLVIVVLVGSSLVRNNNKKAAAATLLAANAATESAVSSIASATPVPTIEPSPTATMQPTAEPTMTAIPTVGLDETGVEIWSLSIDYITMDVDTIQDQDAYPDERLGIEKNDVLNVQIPAANVVVEAHFNQPMPSGVKVELFDLDAVTPWFEGTMTAKPDDATTGVFVIHHGFVLNPPYWEVTYPIKIVSDSGEVFWVKDVRFFKSEPNTCWDGSIPDPVTLYCPNYDGDWNYMDFENFNPNADVFTSGQVPLPDKYKGE